MYLSEGFQTERIYQYVQEIASKPSDEAIHKFYLMLWDGNTPGDAATLSALREMTSRSDFQNHSLTTINRCYYTIINPWQIDSSRHTDARKLILWPESLPSTRGNSKTVRQLRDALREYVSSDYYTVLKRRNRLFEKAQSGPKTVGDYLNNYPVLYVESTRTDDIEKSSENLSSSIQTKQEQKLRQLHNQLTAYIREWSPSGNRATPNPTCLSTRELNHAIAWYYPKRKKSASRRVNTLRNEADSVQTLGEYKDLLRSQIILPFLRRYFARKPEFIGWCDRIFIDILKCPSENSQPAIGMSIIAMFRRILNTILQKQTSSPTTQSFEQLVRRTGHALVTSILLNLVLLCQMARFDLEKGFSRLFECFENAEAQAMSWFIQALEHMNVAMALNAEELSYLRSAS